MTVRDNRLAGLRFASREHRPAIQAMIDALVAEEMPAAAEVGAPRIPIAAPCAQDGRSSVSAAVPADGASAAPAAAISAAILDQPAAEQAASRLALVKRYPDGRPMEFQDDPRALADHGSPGRVSAPIAYSPTRSALGALYRP